MSQPVSPVHPIDVAAAKIKLPLQEAGKRISMPGPPRWLVLAHFAAAAIAFAVFSGAFFWGSNRFLGFDFQSRWALGVVHSLTLGWIAMTLLGSMLQMTSVHGSTPLYRPPLAVAGWLLLTGGVISFIGLLWHGSDRYWMGAAIAASGVALYLIVLIKTMLGARTRDVTYWHFANGLGYLCLLATMGLLLAVDRSRGIIFRYPDGALVAHVHMAIVGWVSMSIVGASYRLVPAVAEYRAQVSRRAGWILAGLVNAGLAGLMIDAIFLGSRYNTVWAILLSSAYAIYLWQAMYGPQPRLTPSFAFTYIALAGGTVWSLLGLCLSFGVLQSSTESRAAYIFAALVGWVTPNILAQIHKIFPFLVWLSLAKILPKERLPEWSELGSSSLAWAEVIFLAAAIPVGVWGFLAENPTALRLCGGLLSACAAAYLAEAVKTFSGIIHTRLKDAGLPVNCPLD